MLGSRERVFRSLVCGSCLSLSAIKWCFACHYEAGAGVTSPNVFLNRSVSAVKCNTALIPTSVFSRWRRDFAF